VKQDDKKTCVFQQEIAGAKEKPPNLNLTVETSNQEETQGLRSSEHGLLHPPGHGEHYYIV
jgi:hypothetical protein